jgi:hypothetical protein
LKVKQSCRIMKAIYFEGDIMYNSDATDSPRSEEPSMMKDLTRQHSVNLAPGDLVRGAAKTGIPAEDSNSAVQPPVNYSIVN